MRPILLAVFLASCGGVEAVSGDSGTEPFDAGYQSVDAGLCGIQLGECWMAVEKQLSGQLDIIKPATGNVWIWQYPQCDVGILYGVPRGKCAYVVWVRPHQTD